MFKKAVIITAGGKGSRMNSDTPKQFLTVKGIPILIHSVLPFIEYDKDILLVIVLPENLIDKWEELCVKHRFEYPHKVVAGGPTRFHSVKNGLKYIPDNHIVAIHDGARPLVNNKTISKVFEFAERFGNAIPYTDVNESVRIVEGAISKPIDRKKIKLIQTPQAFLSDIIKDAYNQNYNERFTDDASVLESKKKDRTFLVEGNHENIKITKQSDLLIAKAFL